ncbi:hypothetical protein, partial [uncultured Desulfovibrio sp.]
RAGMDRESAGTSARPGGRRARPRPVRRRTPEPAPAREGRDAGGTDTPAPDHADDKSQTA